MSVPTGSHGWLFFLTKGHNLKNNFKFFQNRGNRYAKTIVNNSSKSFSY